MSNEDENNHPENENRNEEQPKDNARSGDEQEQSTQKNKGKRGKQPDGQTESGKTNGMIAAVCIEKCQHNGVVIEPGPKRFLFANGIPDDKKDFFRVV